MKHDDMKIAAYKALAYIAECARENVRPNILKAKEVSGANDALWLAVISDLADQGYVRDVEVSYCYDGEADISAGFGFGLTLKGEEFLQKDSRMRAVARFIGKAFVESLPGIIEATKALPL